MAVERLKIRCYQCNQLMAVVPAKIGSVVACPRCKTDLLVPEPEPAAEGLGTAIGGNGKENGGIGGPVQGTSRGPSGSSSGDAAVPLSSIDEIEPETEPAAGPGLFEAEFASMLPPELAALRPEDLRVEAEFHRGPTTTTAPVSRVSEPSSSAQPRVSEPSSPAQPRVSEPSSPAQPRVTAPSRAAPRTREQDRETASTRTPTLTSTSAPTSASASIDAPLHRTWSEAETEPLLPPIQIEPSISLAPRAEPRVVREVTLPASVVLAWSVFVLASLGLAFVAGLLIGHFVWTHVS